MTTLPPKSSNIVINNIQYSLSALILTYNEEVNLRRTLTSIHWIKNVLIIDSGSSDNTLNIASQFNNTKVIYRKFDTFACQCNFGLENLTTDWVLSMDADYILSSKLVDEINAILIKAHASQKNYHGYQARFKYCVNGKQIRSGLLPPRTVLYQRMNARYIDDGHGHRVIVNGDIGKLKGKIYHDDRKELAIWFANQVNYQRIEARKLLETSSRRLPPQDLLRKHTGLAPFSVFLICIFFKGGLIDGKEGFIYALQRLVSESLLYLYLHSRVN